MTHEHIIFDRKRVKQHRIRAMKNAQDYDFLLREMASRLADRLLDVKKTFPLALDLGAHHGVLKEYISSSAGIETWIQSDLVPSSGESMVITDEEFLPFAPNSFDLVMSVGALHWVNDLLGTLIQIQRSLKPDGLFLAMIPGGETLKELRESFEKTELRLLGGISPRVSPFIDVKDGGSLLQRAGFALPVTDSEIITVQYKHPLKLLQDLRGMGETNAMRNAIPHFTRREVMLSAMEYYQEHFSREDGKVEATFECVTLTGWKPHAG